MNELQKRLAEQGIPCLENAPLARASSFKIGGQARLAILPENLGQLRSALQISYACGVKPLIVGLGSNLLFPDGFLERPVVFTAKCKEIKQNGTEWSLDAGASLSSFALHALHAGQTGAEFLYGIPGSVGGAVTMNAGAFGGEMKDILCSSDWFDTDSGLFGSFTNEEHLFGTRTGIYEKSDRYVLLSARLALAMGDPEAIGKRMEDLLAKRKSTQPLEYPSAGSIFKRPVGAYAGKLIEDCGLKGERIGGAEVSVKHAGFIINRGNAVSEDVVNLIRFVKTRVKNETGYDLECEVRILDSNGNIVNV